MSDALKGCLEMGIMRPKLSLANGSKGSIRDIRREGDRPSRHKQLRWRHYL